MGLRRPRPVRPLMAGHRKKVDQSHVEAGNAYKGAKRRNSALLWALSLTFATMCLNNVGMATASTWTIGLNAASAGEADAQALPGPPAPSASCGILGSIKVMWAAITRATTYTIYQSTTSPTSGFSVIASGVAATTYTATGLLGHFWFEVAASIGPNWLGTNSSATSETTVTVVLCSQP